MKKVIGSVLGIIVLIIIVAVVVITFSWSSIPRIISSKLSEKMKVHVGIDSMHIGMHAIDLQKIDIGNPPHSVLPKAFSAQQVLIQAPLMGYLKDPIIIDRIEIHDVYLGLEFKSRSNYQGNWTTIMANMQEGDKGGAKKGGKTVLIRKLVLTNIDVALAYEDDRIVKNLKPIAKLEFDNLSSEEGIPTEQISKIIFDQMLKQIFSIEGLQNMLQDFLQPQNQVDKILQPIKGLFKSENAPLSEDKVR